MVEKEDGKETETVSYDYEISDNVFVVEGSLYCKIGNGQELITYAGINDDVVVADDTTRITALAFAGSDVNKVKMPFTTTSIGHKAFYACDKLEMVTFGSYTAPNFEEEFDPTYYGSFEHIPGSGDFGTYTDYDGNDVQINGMGLVPYFMWNVTDNMYSNVFYGANFVDYVGYVEDKLTMVRPVNGVGYDSFICQQYFDYTIDGPAAPDASAFAAIMAIKAIPERVTYDHLELVKAAREAYDKIATIQQMALVTNYADLVSAEQRITALTPEEEAEEVKEEKKGDATGIIIVAVILVIVAAVVVLFARYRTQIVPAVAKLRKNKNKKKDKEADKTNDEAEN